MTTDAFASFETKLQQFADGLTDDEKQELGLLLSHAVADMERAAPDVQGFTGDQLNQFEIQDLLGRSSAFNSVLANMLKKMSDTSMGITQNLK